MLDNIGIVRRQVDVSIEDCNVVTKMLQWNLAAAISFVRASNMES